MLTAPKWLNIRTLNLACMLPGKVPTWLLKNSRKGGVVARVTWRRTRQRYALKRAPSNFLLKFSHFCYHGNWDRSNINFNFAIKLPLAWPPQPRLVQHFCVSLLHQPSYDYFSVKIPKFSLRWQQGRSEESKKRKKRKSHNDFHACAETTHPDRSHIWKLR